MATRRHLEILQEAINEEPLKAPSPDCGPRAAAQASASPTGEQRKRPIGDVVRHRTTTTSVLITAAVLLVLVGATPGAATVEPSLTEIMQGHDLAVFEWNRLSQVNTTVGDLRLSALRDGGFKTIYVDISEYVEAAAQQPSQTQQDRLTELNAALKEFVASADRHKLAVHAVAGEPNWTDQALSRLGPMTVDLVAAYNSNAEKSGEVQLQGIQFDIEPYVDPAWWTDVKASLQAYLSTIRAIVDHYNQVVPPGPTRLQLGVAIPFWYDGTADVPAVQFGKSSKPAPAAFHLIGMLGTNSRAYVLVMAYRNFASHQDRRINADGSIALVSGEFDYARKSRATCGIVIGQEFGGLTDPYAYKISFGWKGKGRAAFRQAASELVAAYGGRSQFRGLSVNDLDSYEATKEYVTQ